VPPAQRIADRPLVARVVRPVTAFVAVVAAGVAGFVVLADVGAVEAAFWLVDLTSVELHFRDHAGPERATKAFAVLVRAGLVLASLWFGETVLAAAFGGQIREELVRVQTDAAIDDLEDHVVICGYGMFGRTVAQAMAARDRPVVAVETDETEAARAREDGHLVVQGDGRREETLREAGVERAGTLVAAIDDSNANVQIAVVGSQLAPDVRVVVRVGDEMYETLARRAGADEVVIPEVVSGQSLGDRL
jgi:voltage-gated potassium channel